MGHRAALPLLVFVITTIRAIAQPVDPDSVPRPDAGSTNRPSFSRSRNTNDLITRIRDEGLNRSQVMETLSYLSDVIGPRLTGSPNLHRANEWTREKLASWGLTNAHLEAWGPFGRGWSLKRFSAQIVEPQAIPLIGCPSAWSPGLTKPLLADVVYFDVRTNADLEKYKGKLKGAIVLAGSVREVRPRFEPLANRLVETNLLRLANAGPPRAFTPGPQNSSSSTNNPDRGIGGRRRGFASTNNPALSTNGAARALANRSFGRNLAFLAQEGAALVITPSSQGDGGTFFVSSASLPSVENQGTNAPANPPRVWSTNSPATLPQITLAVEDYNRLVRMIKQGERLKMAVDLQVQFHDQDPMAYNTVAEIPGSDLKDEIVMLGAHMDSWHSGTGATDNGAGVAVTMEAVRIIQALKLHPRRTIRIGLWSGEEEGLLGSRAYVASHFGYYTNITNSSAVRSPRDAGGRGPGAGGNRPSANRKLVKGREYEKISGYFNLDNGTGKIRGVYMQGNEGIRPLFRKWLEPFYDLGAETLTLSNTGGTDHLSYDGIGIPGFQFIQDPMDYFTRTHHSNEDVFDRIQADDLRQCATIMAAFVYQTAVLDEKLPRKPVEP
jgi:hypothetical protein